MTVAPEDQPSAQERATLVALYGQGRYAEAEPLALRLTQRYPAHGFGWKLLGSVTKQLHSHAQALPLLQRAAQLLPADPEAHFNLGNSYHALGDSHSAASSYMLALQLRPDFARALFSLGNIYKERGAHVAAMRCFAQAVQADPGLYEAHHNLLFLMNYHPDASAEQIFAHYQAFGAACAARAPRLPPAALGPDPLAAGRPLRIGYVSPDFRRHSCQYALEPLLARHAPARVELHAYAEIDAGDEVTERLRAHFARWTVTTGMDDDSLAARIRADGIHILVDLAGHTARNRLPVFASKPAPVAATWLGYGYTTGLAAVDHFITDAITVPEGSEHLFSEQVWRLPRPALVYRPAAGMGEPGPLPALARGQVTFGSLSRTLRLNLRVVRTWVALLRAVPGACLLINSVDLREPWQRDALAGLFAAEGIEAGRLDLGFDSPPWEVMRRIDIGLDCFPHNCGTTLLESLYMGIPFVTLAARPSVGRLGSSLLHAVGRAEWIAQDEAHYVRIAAGLAADLGQLAAQRAGLRQAMQASPLMDERGFASAVEDAFEALWRRHLLDRTQNPL